MIPHTTNLSRRGIIGRMASIAAGSAAAVALAPAIGAASIIEPPTMPAIVASGPTEIQTLWRQVQKLRRQHHSAKQRLQELREKLPSLVGPPPEALIFSPQNDPSILKPAQFEIEWSENFVHSRELRNLLAARSGPWRVSELTADTTAFPASVTHLIKEIADDGSFKWTAIHDVEMPVTDRRVKALAAIQERLDLSLAHEKKIKAAERKLGINTQARNTHEILYKIERAERKIMRLPAANANDIRTKVAIYKRKVDGADLGVGIEQALICATGDLCRLAATA
jgi:hypothetical protein